MPNNNFLINILAVDKATAVVKSIKDSFGTITRPIDELQKSFASLGRETGFDKLGKSLLEFGSVTGGIATQMSGLGAAAGFGLSISALGEGIKKWAEYGAEVGKTSSILGATTDQVQTYRGIARLADVDTGAMDNAWKSLGTTMQDVFYHRAAPQTITALNQMHIGFNRLANGAPDVENGINQIADAVHSLPTVEAQRTLLNALGLSDDLLPLLQKGKAGIAELRAEIEKTNNVINQADLKKAEELKNSFVLLGSALEGRAGRLAATVDLSGFTKANANWIGGSGPNPWAQMASNGIKAISDYQIPTSALLAYPPLGALALTAGSVGAAGNYLTSALFGNSNSAPVLNGVQTGPSNGAAVPSLFAPGGIPLPMPSSGSSSDNAAPPSVRDVTNAATALAPKMSLEVIMKNAPAGMQARATTDDGSHVPVRIEYGLPTTTMP